MAYFYVKNGGTAINDEGRYAIQQTGSFATLTNYYNSLQDLLLAATPPVLGDTVYISSANIQSGTTPNTTTLIKDVIYVSVNDVDIVAYLPGAMYGHNIDNNLFSINSGTVYIYGITFYSLGFVHIDSKYSCVNMYDCSFSSLNVRFSGAGGLVNTRNTELIIQDTSFHLMVYNNVQLILDGGSLSGNCGELVYAGGAGGSTVHFINFDLSNLANTLVQTVIFEDTPIIVTLFRCILNPAMEYTVGILPTSGSIIEASACSRGNDYNNYYYFKSVTRTGEIVESTSVYRLNGATYDGTNGFSIEYQPNINVIENIEPLEFNLGTYALDLINGSTITVHMLLNDETNTPIELNNTECWAEVTYPDTTNITLGTVISTKPELFSIPSVLPTSIESWNLESNFATKQKILINIPAVNLINAPVSVKFYLAKDITQSTNEMFVCPSLEI